MIVTRGIGRKDDENGNIPLGGLGCSPVLAPVIPESAAGYGGVVIPIDLWPVSIDDEEAMLLYWAAFTHEKARLL
jgi:hypothetical protein